MKIFELRYFANHYANGGNWTHVVKVSDGNDTVIALEENKAADVKSKMGWYLSGKSLDGLLFAMKYRNDFTCSLLLSPNECEFLKENVRMQTYQHRH